MEKVEEDELKEQVEALDDGSSVLLNRVVEEAKPADHYDFFFYPECGQS